uniref:Uncharacterized protein n=1 Tax=Equus asinus TaxID=9793 RepID=A0A9L0IIY1_EQUAS
MQISLQFQEEYSANKLHYPLQKKAQKGTVGRNLKENLSAVKFQKAVTGASLADITAKRNHKTEIRGPAPWPSASKKTATDAAKAPTKAAIKQKIVKPMKVSAPRVGRKH